MMCSCFFATWRITSARLNLSSIRRLTCSGVKVCSCNHRVSCNFFASISVIFLSANKNPRVFSPGVLGVSLCIITLQSPGTPGKSLVHDHYLTSWANRMARSLPVWRLVAFVNVSNTVSLLAFKFLKFTTLFTVYGLIIQLFISLVNLYLHV